MHIFYWGLSTYFNIPALLKFCNVGYGTASKSPTKHMLHVSTNAMRKNSDICLLCKENLASQKDSHIIPKFLGQGIFYGTNPRHGLLVDKEGSKKKVQDILKEDYLFCSDCEKGFSIYETYCSLRLERFNDVRYIDNFKRVKAQDFEFVECEKIDIKIFNLFIYSIIWRVAISENKAFKAFKLSGTDKENIREILKMYSSPTQEKLLNKLDKFQNIPKHSHVFLRPVKKLRPPVSFLSASSYNEYLHQIHLVDYVLLYSASKDVLSGRFNVIDNNRDIGYVKMGLIEEDRWKSFNRTMFNEAIDK